MIILKHLTVERFRLLREINLHFPQRGSILIQGPNEAGKSALFESIYFALYGQPHPGDERRQPHPGDDKRQPALHGKRSSATLDDLVLYGETKASVTLTLSVGATELVVTRSIERGKGQQVMLRVCRLGMPDEEIITHLEVANERIISELSGLDGEALRNSCFIEQKGLVRLEELRGSEREATLHKLLGLEKLTRLSEQFKLTAHDEQLLHECTERLKLAEIQMHIPELSMQLGKLEAALDAVTVSEELAEIGQQEVEFTEQEVSLEQVQKKRSDIKSRQARVAQLKKAEAILAQIIAAYDTIAEAQRELPELERQVAELERIEREELPVLENRVRELSDLTRSFGTLERLAADLLTAVNTIKELEQELKSLEHLEDDLAAMDEELIHARLNLEQAQQTRHELEEQKLLARPQVEARLQRLRDLAQRLASLKRAEERYAESSRRLKLADENSVQLKKVTKELQETEQELTLVESEARQTQQQADEIEMHWRQLSIRRQLEEWQRLERLAQGLTEAEQHVMAAHEQQEQFTVDALAARRGVTIRLGIVIACVVLFVLCGGGALLEATHQPYLATGAGIIALLCAAGAGYNYLNYTKAREKERVADRLMQEAVSRVSMMVTAREAAMRAAGNIDSLAQIEHEIHSLGGTIPRSIQEANEQLEQLRDDHAESLADIQQTMTDKHNSALAARNQVNVTMEAVAALRKEAAQLEEQRQKEGWDQLDQKLRSDKENIDQMRQTIATMAGEEGLPIPSFATPPSPADLELPKRLEEAIKSTGQEIAGLDGKLDALPELDMHVKACQEVLDVLQTRKKAIAGRQEQFHTQNPSQKIERARKQQDALREALRVLQDSLRQRVQPLGVPFGQTAITSAETGARKQLETLHIALGRRLELQNRHVTYAATLKEHQELLSDHYQQLAKLSGSLGSWIVPPNPFADALLALRTRCQREIQEANESGLLKELEQLKVQEGASNAKMELCRQEIEEIQELIATMLAQRNRPSPRGYTLTDVTAVWPLVGEYAPADRSHLETERARIEEELQHLEEQELTLSTALQTGGARLDLEQARRRMEQQERMYQTRKRGSLLIDAVVERIMHKMQPRTEYYMQQLLPLLTHGRYRDLRLATEPEEGAFQLQVWESAAGEYIAKSALSGGTADQISLALRLAFAIAALPRELAAAPGFMLLDEPLSSFDRDRMQAFVDIVTGDLLGQHFEQILLISHSSAFDPALFPYHVYVDAGQVVESNLPVVSAPSLSGSNGYSNNGNSPAVQVPVSVSSMVQ